MINPLRCERCGSQLESDDAISIIEGLCNACRRQGYKAPVPMILDPAPPAAHARPRPAQPRPLSRTTPGPSRSRPVGDLGLPRARIQAPFVAATLPHEPTYSTRIRRRRRDLAIGIGVGLTVTIAFTAAILFNRAEGPMLTSSDQPIHAEIDLKVVPAFASVKLDGQEIGPADRQGRLKLRLTGDATTTRWLEVSANGFLPLKRPLSLVGGAEEISVELSEQAYETRICAEPADAEIWISGKYKGRGEVRLTLLPREKPELVIKRPGFAEVRREITPPRNGGPLDMRIALAPISPGAPAGMGAMLAAAPQPEPKRDRRQARIEIATDPPGGRVLIDGDDVGESPTTALFDAGEAGRSIEIEASLGVTRQGRKRITIPEAGRSVAVRVPMDAVTQRVVFLIDSACERRSDLAVLGRELAARIHALDANQSFAILAAGGAAWPGGDRYAPASSEQKVRAYDLVRLLRPGSRIPLSGTLKTAQCMKPTAIVCLSAASFDRQTLEECQTVLQPADFGVHLIAVSNSDEDEWLHRFAARCRGTYRVLDRSTTVALRDALEN